MTSSGKTHHKFKNLTGQRFGMLLALEPTKSTGKSWRWSYLCDCGQKVEKLGSDVTKELRRGGTPNCGCATAKLIGQKNSTHGMTKHPAYAVYRSMVGRCSLPTHQAWANYGGRGVTVCDRWAASFENFWEDMGGSYQRGLDLDRVDNDKGYAPENCRWVDRRTNAMNTRRTIRQVDVPKLSAETGIGRTTLYNRIKAGWSLEKLTLPPDARNRYSTS